MKYRVVVTDTVRALIREQASYIAHHEELPQRAAEWLVAVIDAAESLATRPRRFGFAEEHGARPYEIRRIVVGGCLLLFSVADESRIVFVIGFRHGRQRPKVGRLPTILPER